MGPGEELDRDNTPTLNRNGKLLNLKPEGRSADRSFFVDCQIIGKVFVQNIENIRTGRDDTAHLFILFMAGYIQRFKTAA